MRIVASRSGASAWWRRSVAYPATRGISGRRKMTFGEHLSIWATFRRADSAGRGITFQPWWLSGACAAGVLAWWAAAATWRGEHCRRSLKAGGSATLISVSMIDVAWLFAGIRDGSSGNNFAPRPASGKAAATYHLR